MPSRRNLNYRILREGAMELFRDIQLTFDGKSYEIRVLYDDRTINVLAFHNNYPASGFRHQIQIPKSCDIQGVLGQDIIDDLIEFTKNEILENKWEKVSKTFKKS